MTWRAACLRASVGFVVGNVVGFVGMAVGDLLVFRRRKP